MPDGRHEGAPVSLMEAAAAGLVPCIAQLPGADHLLIDPAAQQLPARDLQGWAAQMAALTARPDLPALSGLTAQRAAALAWPNLIDQWARFVD
jgi:glycosyltransferase involved in cell wall biosynthesis